jgi:hypothetical protein
MILLTMRRAFWLTILGVMTVFLIGPVVTVIGAVLPFTLVGALVWGVWWGVRRLVRRIRLQDLRERIIDNDVLPAVARGAGCAVRQGVRQCKLLGPVVRERVRQGLHHCQEFAPVFRERGQLMGRKAARFARTAARMVVEIACGAAVGGLVAWYTLGSGEQTAIATGALLGGALGFVIGGPKRKPAQEQIVLE